MNNGYNKNNTINYQNSCSVKSEGSDSGKYNNNNLKQNNSNSKFNSIRNGNNKYNNDITCYNCGKYGHFGKKCRAPKKKQQRSFNIIALANTQTLYKNSWCIDSGATAHICCDRHMFKTFTYYEEKIMLASEKFVECSGIGEVDLYGNNELILKNVLYVPSMIMNFISVANAVSGGFTVNFDKNIASIIDSDGTQVLIAHKMDNLFIFEPQHNFCNFTTTSSTSNIIQWHNRFGHLNYKSLIESARKNIVLEIDIKNIPSNLSCQEYFS